MGVADGPLGPVREAGPALEVALQVVEALLDLDEHGPVAVSAVTELVCGGCGLAADAGQVVPAHTGEASRPLRRCSARLCRLCVSACSGGSSPRRQAISSRAVTFSAPAIGIASSAPTMPPISAPAATLTAIASGESCTVRWYTRGRSAWFSIF